MSLSSMMFSKRFYFFIILFGILFIAYFSILPSFIFFFNWARNTTPKDPTPSTPYISKSVKNTPFWRINLPRIFKISFQLNSLCPKQFLVLLDGGFAELSFFVYAYPQQQCAILPMIINAILIYENNFSYNSYYHSMEFDPSKKPTYIFRHPFRFVKPYSHIFQTHAKQRWLGKPLLETLSKQFQAYSQQYFREAIKAGKVRINGKTTEASYTFRNSDLLHHQTIRQEPPILNMPVEIIHEDETYLVVCKPPSMVVHTGGGYHYNTLMAILYYEKGYQNLYILHRIDRLTSGVVILSKKKQKTTKFHEQSMQEVMKKCYYARVNGNVSFAEKIVQLPMICLSHRQGVWGVYDPETMKDLAKIQQPKQSTTKFVKIWYDQKTDSSLLQCFPVTGRTHQIRVHLQHLNHPILNDVVYGGKFVGNWAIGAIQKQKNQAQSSQSSTELQEWLSKWDHETRPLEIFLHSHKYRFEGNQYASKKPYWTERQIRMVELSQQKQEKIRDVKTKSAYEAEFLKNAKGKAEKNLQKEYQNQPIKKGE